MAIEVTMPPGGQTTHESMIAKWHKAVGDRVHKGEALFDIETDKAVMEIESFTDGILLAAMHAVGDYVSTGEVVAYIGNEGEKIPEVSVVASASQHDEYQPIMRNDTSARQSVDMPSEAASSHDGRKAIASPAARHLARQENIEIDKVTSILKRQNIRRSDVESFINRNAEAAKDDQEYYYIDCSTMRRTIARRMVESISSVPAFHVTVEVEMSRAMDLRQEINDYLMSTGLKVSFNDIIMKCASKAIANNPSINSSYEEDRIRIHRNVNFGLAVGLDNGVMVPVVREVDKKPLVQIARENMGNIEKARSGKLRPEQTSGGTITLSSLGMYGVDRFTAMINHPESCILAIGAIIEKPVVKDGKIVPGNMMSITAAFDHRVIDGAVGAAFLKDVKTILEKPHLLLA